MTPERGSVQRFALIAILLACGLTGCGGGHQRFLSHLHLGQDYLAHGNLDKASVEFRNATQIEPRNAEGLYYSGQVAEARGNLREAMGLYLGCLELAPNYDAVRARLGRLFVFGGATQRALDTITPALSRHPDDPDLLAVRAGVHERLKEDDAA